ncbi:MAG: RNA polymerase subunit sigma-70 [Bacteroidetes bacterium HGW-Bacteroidetes-8]|jgi:RNA polymerase sigma-70 factor (ECF subfamily)|nr:MAG: RNA polymerase subunit sigma-70 [Bacteroidetes bacterium HGW-Bacteroidetes-8]
MKREEELRIIELIRNGDQELYKVIVEEYSPRVLSVIRGVIPCREDAEEVAQDVFVKAFFSLNKFRGDSSLSTWLFRIAYNMSISKTRLKKVNFVPVDSAQISSNYCSDNSEEEAYIREKRFELLNRMLSSLDTSERFLIALFYNHEKSIKEIADITGTKESNVKVKLHRIKKRMGEMVDEKMEVSYG